MSDKLKRQKVIERKRGKVINAVKKTIELLKKLGIRSEVIFTDNKLSEVYLAIRVDDMGNAIGNKVKKRLKRLDRNIECNHVFENKILLLLIVPTIPLSEKEIEEVREEIEKFGIIDKLEYTGKLIAGIKAESIAEKLNEMITNHLRKSIASKIRISTFLDDNVYIVRFSK